MHFIFQSCLTIFKYSIEYLNIGQHVTLVSCRRCVALYNNTVNTLRFYLWIVRGCCNAEVRNTILHVTSFRENVTERKDAHAQLGMSN